MLRLSLVRPITAHLEHYQKLGKINYDSGLYWIWIGTELHWWFFSILLKTGCIKANHKGGTKAISIDMGYP